MEVALEATDNAAAAGIEYRLGSRQYVRYTSSVVVPDGASLAYRAVDVNGNVERVHVLRP
jgi:hypothetical protein